jgi:hypothetical protein
MSRPDHTVTLQFDDRMLIVGEDIDIRNQLSAVVLDGDRLWLACDEGCRLERLSRARGGSTFAQHQVFDLAALLDLPAPPEEEADIEGLAVDDGWLWLVGSHAVKRKQPKGKSPAEVARKLLETTRDGNRQLLARIPLKGDALQKRDGGRRAAALPATTKSSDLLKAVRAADHLKPFVDVPGKDNGFDIEGLAARGGRLWVGLRGPVLREWCCILELEVEAEGHDLRLVRHKKQPYRKHFLKLDGLGVRDIALLDDDLLILAGPPMAHDGPAGIWRWKNAAKKHAAADPGDVAPVLRLPQAKQEDKPEGLTVIGEGVRPAVLVVFDSPSAKRKPSATSVFADVYKL